MFLDNIFITQFLYYEWLLPERNSKVCEIEPAARVGVFGRRFLAGEIKLISPSFKRSTVRYKIKIYKYNCFLQIFMLPFVYTV